MEGGRRDPPFLLPPPAPALGGSHPGRDAAAAAAAPPSAKAAASSRAGERKRNPRARPCCWPGRRPLRRSNASWVQPRRSLGLDSRRREGPLPPGPRGAGAASFSSSRSPLLPPGGRRCPAHSHAHREEPRPRRPQSCRRAHGPRLPAPREQAAGGGLTCRSGLGEEERSSREGRCPYPSLSPPPRSVRRRRLAREDGCLSPPPAAPPRAPSRGGPGRRPPAPPPAVAGLGWVRPPDRSPGSWKPPSRPGPSWAEGGGSGGAFSRIYRTKPELELSMAGRAGSHLGPPREPGGSLNCARLGALKKKKKNQRTVKLFSRDGEKIPILNTI